MPLLDLFSLGDVADHGEQAGTYTIACVQAAHRGFDLDRLAAALDVDVFAAPAAGLAQGRRRVGFVFRAQPAVLANLGEVASKRVGGGDAVLPLRRGVEVSHALVVVDGDDRVAYLREDFSAEAV